MANEADKKKKKKKILIFSIIGFVILVLIALVIIGGKREPVITVETEIIKRTTITKVVNATGKIQPEKKVKINAEVSGEIIELKVREGERVKKGQLLVRIKQDAYQAGFEKVQANLTMAQANLRKSEAEYKRVTELYAKKLVSDSDMDIATANYQATNATYNQALAQVKESKETLSKTTIYSPMDGAVSQLISEVGERVSGSSFTQGTEIMTIADLSRMEARVEVGENEITNISKGDTARIEVDSYPEKKFIGIVTQIANTAKSRGLGTQDEITNFEVRILINTPEGVQFRPGMSMNADIETETRKNVLAIPIQSLTTREDESKKQENESEEKVVTENKKKDNNPDEIIFIVKNGIAKTVKVKTGISNSDYYEIKDVAELEGAEVVKGPYKAVQRELKDGSKVKVDNKKVQSKKNK